MGNSRSETEPGPLTGLAVGAAHDLRNVLFVIGAHCQRLLQAAGPGGPAAEDLRAIKDASDRGTALARQILASASTQAPPRPVEVNAAVLGVEPLLRRMIGEAVSMDVRLAPQSWTVQATATQVEQVVMNLAINARDAMPRGGRLTIATENRTVPGGGPTQPAHYVVLSVSDTGSGIAPELQERIFEPFFTTKRDAGGTGVGLATVRTIALMSGGHIEVSSVPGEGTTMRVVFPRVSAGTPPESPGAGDPPEDLLFEPGEGRRVLLVEDEGTIRDLLSRWLAMQGFDPLVACTGQEALGLCPEGGPPLDLVITDVRLPDMDGATIVRRLRSRHEDLPAVYMSGAAEALLRIAAGGSPVLTKPFSMIELARAVKSVLAARQAA